MKLEEKTPTAEVGALEQADRRVPEVNYNKGVGSQPAGYCVVTGFMANEPVNKVIGIDPDTGEITKKAKASIYAGYAQSVSAGTQKEMAVFLEKLTTNQSYALMLGEIANAKDGVPFTIRTKGAMRELVGNGGDAIGVQKVGGVLYAARDMRGISHSKWLLIDADNPPGIPADWAVMDIQKRLEFLEPLIPGISQCARVEMRSSGSRVRHNSELGKPASHAFIEVSNPECIDAMRAQVQIKMLDGHSFGFDKHDKATKEICAVENRTVIDLAVWGVGRLIFTADPTLRADALDAGYVLDDADIQIVNEDGGMLDISKFKMPSKKKLKEYSKKTGSRTKLSKNGRSLSSVIRDKLSMDTLIDNGSETKPVEEWLPSITPGGDMRCQTPFRPGSKSMAGRLHHNKNGSVHLYDHIGVTYSMRKTAPAAAQQVLLKDLTADSLKSTALAALVKDLLQWDPVAEEWYRYQGGCWRQLNAAQVMHELSNFLDGELTDGYSMTLLRNMMKFLQIRLVNTGWGTARDMLPMANGVLDLATMKLLPHSAGYKFQWILPYAFDAKADCPTVKNFLLDATDGDAEAVESIRGALLFALLFHLGTQKFMEILGPGGTGKSTLVRLIQELIGKENCVTTDLKNLEGNRFESAGLYGKRVAYINDSSRYSGEVSQLKAISGEDPIRFEKKGKQQDESFLAECFVFIVSNEPIQSADYTSGLNRRRVPINFLKQITDADRNKWKARGGIEEVMKKELPGMLNWVINMGKDAALAAMGGINGKMSKTQLKHLLQTNALAAWVEDNCVLIPGVRTYTGTAPKLGGDPKLIEEAAATKLYSNYHQWCHENGHKSSAVQQYGRNLEDLLVNMLKLPVEWLEKDVGGRSFSGITLRNTSHKSIPTPILEKTLS